MSKSVRNVWVKKRLSSKDRLSLKESSISEILKRLMVVKRAPARIIELVNPTAIGKRADWIVVPRKLKNDCSRIPSSRRDKGLIKLDRIKRILGNKKTSSRRGCSA